LETLTPARFERVLGPKVIGARLLDEATAVIPLDFFVVFSSAASVIGSPVQGNYAAANACADALVHARRARGSRALSINWGPWDRVGMTAHAPPQQVARLRA